MQVVFRDYTSPKEVPYLFYLLRKKLDDVPGQLPSGILGPVVNDEFSDVDLILYMMTSDSADYAQLKKAAEGFRQRLLRVPGVKKVDLYGTQDERIYVEFSHAKLATLGVTPQAMLIACQAERRDPGRHGRNGVAARAAARHRRARRREGRRRNAGSDDGRVFRLGDIATVKHGFVIRRLSRFARKASPRSASASLPPRAPTSSSSARTSRRRPRTS